MKYLVVNGDDFGTSRGVNRGIVEAHETGILTSASLMVDSRAAAEAAQLAAQTPSLGIGLHVVLEPTASAAVAESEVARQLERFRELTGQPPTHIDSHHDVHRDADLLPAFRAVANRHGLPLRGYSGVRDIATFYGQWNGETNLGQISPEAIAKIVDTEVQDGFNELYCHPGYVNGELVSSYRRERETELETLCNPEVAALLAEREIRLVTFRELPQR
jgi:chitin disaccharide deacetylase